MIWGIAFIVVIITSMLFDEETSLWIFIGILIFMGIGMAITKEEK